MQEFVEVNKFPILKKIDQNYLTKIQREKKIMIISAINRFDNQHISFLNNYFHYLALENRENYIFSYLDFKEDKYFFNFFNIDLSKFYPSRQNSQQRNNDYSPNDEELKPIVIIYNFKLNKYFIDPDSFSDDKNYLKISDKKQLKILLERVEANNIPWTSGYLIEDFFTGLLGSDISPTKLLMIYSSIFFLIFAFILIFICNCIERKHLKVKSTKNKKKNTKQQTTLNDLINNTDTEETCNDLGLDNSGIITSNKNELSDTKKTD